MKFKSIFASSFIGSNIFFIHLYVGVTSQKDSAPNNQIFCVNVTDKLTNDVTYNYINELYIRGNTYSGGEPSRAESSQAASSRKKKSATWFTCIPRQKKQEEKHKEDPKMQYPIKQFNERHPLCDREPGEKINYCLFVKEHVLTVINQFSVELFNPQEKVSPQLFGFWLHGNVWVKNLCEIKTMKTVKLDQSDPDPIAINIRALKCFNSEYVTNQNFYFYLIEGNDDKSIFVAIPLAENEVRFLYKLTNFDYNNSHKLTQGYVKVQPQI